jgi:predicted phosphodiesterase
VEAAGLRLHLLHDLKTLAFEPAAARVRVVISGHSHKPQVETRDGVLYVNPGSAGPRRFKLPVTLARLVIGDGQAEATIVTLLP